jgi:hypothetical protein
MITMIIMINYINYYSDGNNNMIMMTSIIIIIVIMKSIITAITMIIIKNVHEYIYIRSDSTSIQFNN